MTCETTPYHKINKLFLTIIGQWPYQSSLSKRISYIIMLFFTTTHGYLQTAGMIAARIDIDVFLEALPTVLADVVCGVKMINFFCNAVKMKKLLMLMEKDWKTFSTDKENEILNEYAHFGYKVTIYYAGALYGTVVPMMLVPLAPLILNIVAPMNESYPKHLMFQQIEFLFDFEKYFYPLLIHGYLGTFAYLTILIAIDTMFMVYIQHACAKFLIVGLSLNRVAEDDNINSQCTKSHNIDYQKMINCLTYHNEAIEFANLIEESNYFSFIFVIGINMLMMTASGLVAVFKMNEPNVAMKFAAFTLGEVFHLFYSSWQGELLLEHSASIFYTAYQANWNNTSLSSQRLFIPLLLRSATPCKLTAGKMYTMSLKSFSLVVKTSFSYLTVFMTMHSRAFRPVKHPLTFQKFASTDMRIISYVLMVYSSSLLLHFLEFEKLLRYLTMEKSEGAKFFSDPAYDVQVKILGHVGVWFYQSKKVKRIWKFIYVFVHVSGLIPVMHATYVDHSAHSLFSSLPLYIVIFVSVTKYTNVHLQWDKLMAILNSLQYEWKVLPEGPCKDIMRRHAYKQRKIAQVFLMIFAISVLIYVSFPMAPKIFDVLGFIDGPTRLEFPYPVDYWCDDQENYYWILAHLCFCAFVVMSMLTGNDTIAIMLLQHVCAVYETINYRLETLTSGENLNIDLNPPKSQDKPYYIVIDCIKTHNRIIEYCKMLEEFYRWELFVVISAETFLMTFTGIRLVLDLGEPFEAARYIVFVVTQAIHVFFLSQLSQIMIDCSTGIRESIIGIKWYALSTRTRKLLNLIIIRSSVPNYLTVGKIFVLSLEFFIAIIKTSMSYFTLLRSVQEED
ncbi:uncharacterized protein [Chelonus insularis]|uniref:uncharacterized protein n=1 Tax=Chelonus insularis TaxID=460826 RepID=UPI00158F5302|nr:uncharacterized protein LOC118066451 [Chelonus insularis]